MYKVILLFSTTFACFGQTDFENYSPLVSSGEIPSDFTQNTYEKLDEELKADHKGLSLSEEKRFYEGINYAVDDLMHSGYVTYGDPITEYIEDVARKLMVGKKDLKKELRFYTLKTDAVNAFSTEQGIVFVTTGLISQLVSEAQLALILAHEISHYEEHHVLASFKFKKENRKNSIENLSVYSKEKEFEADKLGLEMYAKAGYSLDDVLPTFDVLLYSYLPFDEVEIKLDYFQSVDSLTYPSWLFPSEVYEITASENEDDNRSSHPNIHKRKEAMVEALNNVKSRGNDSFKLGEAKFEEIRDIARFEVLRSQVFEAEYGRALYSAYLLETKYPNSSYLKRMKAQIWYGALQYNLENDLNDVVPKKSNWEGASASVYYMLKEPKSDAFNALCARQITDLKNANPDSKEISAIYDLMIKRLSYSSKFDLSDYAVFNMETARKKFEAQNETSDKEVVEVKSSSSKYDRIKKKRDVNEVMHFDSTEFHKYLIPDLITDDVFLSLYNKYQEEIEEEDRKEEEYNALTKAEKKKYNKEQSDSKLHLGINDVISVEPMVLKINRKGVDRVRSEKLSDEVSSVMTEVAELAGVSLHSISSNDLETKGTEAFNERSLLMHYLEQTARHRDIEAFPVDYNMMNELENKYGTSKIQFTWFTHQYNADIGFGAVLAIIAYPVAPLYFPIKIFSGNKSTIASAILDTKTGSIDAFIDYSYNAGVRKHIIGSHLYKIYSTIKIEK